MHWLIHNKFDNDKSVCRLMSNLERMGIGYTRATVVPFSDDGIIFEDESITTDTLKHLPIFTYGSYTMARISTKYFKPAAFISPFIAMDYLLQNYGNEMLNSDLTIGTIRNTNPDMEMFFIRPVEDTKSICGDIWSKEDFNCWKEKVLANDIKDSFSVEETYSTVIPDTVICIAPYKKIDAEFRCFVVNGKVVTASQYKSNSIPYFSAHVDDYIIDYANEMVNHWQPDKAFTLDIALYNDKPCIIEANCINSCGLYEADTQKLIMAVEEL